MYKQMKVVWICILCVFLTCILIANLLSFTDFSRTIQEQHHPYKEIVDNCAIVVDMGSSGTRISIFGWDDDHTLQHIPFGGRKYFHKSVQLGIARALQVSDVLGPLLDYAHNTIKVISVGHFLFFLDLRLVICIKF